MPKVIKVQNLSKAYQLGDFGTGTISRDLERFWARMRGKEDPFLKIGEVNDRAIKGTSDIVWSLKDINFEIEQGDAVGIIGRNGAGKSTLLKVLSRVTSPTSGKVRIKGRMASLLEVGTGFHPELTGRENIYLNGAILGMRKAEIKRRFDEIVDFSGVERYIDTPVKRYSSGMYVRLAFGVAAHLESEILVVDEVLAVGDAEFQKKCLGKMGDMSKGEGRTILFVSHNMGAVKALCKNGIVLNSGQLELSDNMDNAVAKYLADFSNEESTKFTNNQLIWRGITKREFNNTDKIELKLNFFSNSLTEKFYIDFGISKNLSDYVLHLKYECYSYNGLEAGKNGEFSIILSIDPCYLVPADYKMTIYMYDYFKKPILWIENIEVFSISAEKNWGGSKLIPQLDGSVIPPFKIHIEQ